MGKASQPTPTPAVAQPENDSSSSGAWHRGPNLHMTLQRMEHVGSIVVDDLGAVTTAR
jgi:hypothetical protein